MATISRPVPLKRSDADYHTPAHEQTVEPAIIVRDFAYPVPRSLNVSTPTPIDQTPVPAPESPLNTQSASSTPTENSRKLPYTHFYDPAWTLTADTPQFDLQFNIASPPPPPPLIDTNPLPKSRHESTESSYSQYSTVPSAPARRGIVRPLLETLVSGISYRTEKMAQSEPSLAKVVETDGMAPAHVPRLSDRSDTIGRTSGIGRQRSDNSSTYSQYSTAT